MTAPDGFDGDHFRLPVIRQDRLLIGVPRGNDAGNRADPAHVVTLQDGSQESLPELTPPGIDDTGDLFGSTCVFGHESREILLGAFLKSIEGDTEGGLRVFHEKEEAYRIARRLSRPREQPAAYFGRSIEVENGILAMGTPGLLGFRHRGVAFHSIRDDSSPLDEMLLPNVPIQYQVLGESIDFDGDLLVVGSPFEDTFGPTAGAVHVYRISNGIPDLEATLRSNEPSRGERIMIGAGASSPDGTYDGGAAWVHEHLGGGWTGGTSLHHAEAVHNDFFGPFRAFDDDRGLVGTPRHGGAGGDTGDIAVFDLQNCDDSGLLDAGESPAVGSRITTETTFRMPVISRTATSMPTAWSTPSTLGSSPDSGAPTDRPTDLWVAT